MGRATKDQDMASQDMARATAAQVMGGQATTDRVMAGAAMGQDMAALVTAQDMATDTAQGRIRITSVNGTRSMVGVGDHE